MKNKTDVCELPQDERRIKGLFWSGEGEPQITVGTSRVTEIVAYYECGQMAGVPWFAVFRGDGITGRYNAAKVESMIYFEEGEYERLHSSPE